MGLQSYRPSCKTLPRPLCEYYVWSTPSNDEISAFQNGIKFSLAPLYWVFKSSPLQNVLFVPYHYFFFIYYNLLVAALIFKIVFVWLSLPMLWSLCHYYTHDEPGHHFHLSIKHRTMFLTHSIVFMLQSSILLTLWMEVMDLKHSYLHLAIWLRQNHFTKCQYIFDKCIKFQQTWTLICCWNVCIF